MNRIKSITQLRTEQLRLARERRGLEDNIRRDWRDIRHSFDPAEYTREALASGLHWLGRRLFQKEEPSKPFARINRIFSKRSK
jgi:hypothetical protein